MSTYYPDRWVILEITPKNGEVFYKVFASCYTITAAWRLNSGITKVISEDKLWLFLGASGSIYTCHKECYGLTLGTMGALKSIIANALTKVRKLSHKEALEVIEKLLWDDKE